MPEPSTIAPAAVLIVDDTPENRDILARRVRQLGHGATEASDGAQALALLAANPFDLVLLDIMMPGLSGYDVLERMKADAALRHIPVVVISALTDIDSVVRCVELGAEDYLFKPFNTTLLRARVTASLEKKKLRDQEQRYLSQIRDEQQRSQNLLRSIFPPSIAERLQGGESAIAEQFDSATILFADIQDFSRLTQKLAPAAVVELLNKVFTRFDALAAKFGCEKIKTVGDAYMAAAGVPKPRPDHAAAAADLALAMQESAAGMDVGLDDPLTLRIGVGSGPVVAGVLGTSRLAYDLWGRTARLASQMESLGLPGAIQVDQATHNLLKADYVLEERGTFYVQGDGDVSTFLLTGRRRPR